MAGPRRPGRQSLWRIASGLAPVTLLVQALSLGSSLALALVLGASYRTDAYYLALSVPVIVYSILLYAVGSGAIPTLTVHETDAELGDAASDLLTIVLIASVVLSVLISAMTVVLLPIVVGGPPRLTHLMRLIIVELAPYGVTGAVAGLLTAILAVRGRYLAAMAATGFEPLMKSVLVLVFRHPLGVQALVLGNLIGSGLAVACLWLLVSRQGLRLRVLRRPRSSTARLLIALSLPLLISQAALQINPLVDRATASGLYHGSVTVLELGLRLFTAPTLLIGAVVVGPLTAVWSARSAEAGFSEVSASFGRALTALVVLLPPCLVVAYVLRHQLAQLFYVGGAYTSADIRQTGSVTGMLVLGLPAQNLILLLGTMFVVQRDTVFPMKVALANVVLNAVLDLVLRGPLGVPGVALSTTLTITLLSVTFVFEARRRWGELGLRQVRRPLMLALPSSALVAAIALLASNGGGSTRADNLALVVGVGAAGLAVHAAVLRAGGVSITQALPLSFHPRRPTARADGSW